jgi:RHS repeat-associated protein
MSPAVADLIATVEAMESGQGPSVYIYDEVGNVVYWNGSGGGDYSYTYGPDNRLRQARAMKNAYDHQGRRVHAKKPSDYQGQPSTEHHFWAYDSTGQMLVWHKRNVTAGGFGQDDVEEYIYLNGERLAKVVVTEALIGSGGGGGGGCCCASTAIAYDGRGQCEAPACHALAVLRGFRNQVLSGNALGETLIRFYYRELSPVAVRILRAYPELRQVLSYGLRAVAWVLEIWVKPAQAMQPGVGVMRRERVYWYHNDHLGTPVALTDESGAIVYEKHREPFGVVAVDVMGASGIQDNFLFPGQFGDSDAGLFYNWNRWHAPEIGRYLQVDPLDASTLLDYAYKFVKCRVVAFGTRTRSSLLNTFGIRQR